MNQICHKLGTFWLGTFWLWDVLTWEVLIWDILTWDILTLERFDLGRFDFGMFWLGTFWLWDVLTWDAMTLGRFDLGRFDYGTFWHWDVLTGNRQKYANSTIEVVELHKSYCLKLVCEKKRKHPRTTGVVANSRGHQPVFNVWVCSFSRNLALWMPWLVMNHYELRIRDTENPYPWMYCPVT